ncbi:MAG: hypothetical protein M3O70_09690 [Actinomycetota bacterium]|nr:hypothetical protein [Actinomycetota bacterium]
MSTTATEPEGDPQQDRRGISEAEARHYVQQLRTAPAEQVVTEVLFTLLNAAHVKLGRRDARLLIDLSTVMLEHLREYVSDDLGKRVDGALGQLRVGQVSAENDAAKTAGETEPNDLDRIPSPPSPAASLRRSSAAAESASASTTRG